MQTMFIPKYVPVDYGLFDFIYIYIWLSWKGLSPCESKETKCTFPLGRCIDQTCWSACYKPHQQRCINISVFPPIDACIGCHILNMNITSCDRSFQRCLGDFDILFNPWCAGKEAGRLFANINFIKTWWLKERRFEVKNIYSIEMNLSCRIQVQILHDFLFFLQDQGKIPN